MSSVIVCDLEYNFFILGKSVLPWQGFFKGPQNTTTQYYTSYSDSELNDESAVSRNYSWDCVV